MDALFLQNIWFEYLGTMSLIGAARAAGFDVGLAIGSDKKLLKAVRTHNPRIVAFSCVTGFQGWVLSLCRKIKELIDPEIKTLVGGPHPTFFPEMIHRFPYVDYLCVGEGEQAFVELLDAETTHSDTTSIANLLIRRQDGIIENPVRPLIEDLDALPFMDRERYYQYPMIRNNPVKRLITGRGCPYSCAFCFNHSAMKIYKGKGRYVRKRSVENVLEEIDDIKKRYPVKTLRFEDDLFGVSRKWLERFCSEYPRRFSIPFICSMRADTIDRDVVSWLKAAGCFNVVIGVESGDETLRNTVLKKNISDDELRHAAALFHEFGINFCTTNILGLPGETFEQAMKTITFNLSLKPTFTWCSVFQPYPRTEMGELVEKQGLVTSLNVDDIEPNYHSRSILKQPDIDKSVNLHKFFYVVFNHPWTLGLVKRLVVLPPNPLFTFIHRVSFLFIYARRWNIRLFRAIQEAVRTSGFSRKVEAEAQDF